ncbi:hypothetical protein HPB48_000751 [Haemaphysalis longicornis]|uniref:Uncharacterized protein n=1 Tax=Haemaphysalis longicornis TaxID=44386 RepID=A0A9J6FK09_HAELO|nr:hypothetical protein HPB48_000751 [Haemaphysalis longicornis]
MRESILCNRYALAELAGSDIEALMLIRREPQRRIYVMLPETASYKHRMPAGDSLLKAVSLRESRLRGIGAIPRKA